MAASARDSAIFLATSKTLRSLDRHSGGCSIIISEGTDSRGEGRSANGQ